MKPLQIVIAVTCVVGAAGCRDAQPPASPAPAQAPGPVPIDIARVVEKPLDVRLSLPGELTAYQSVALFARVSGFVKTIGVDRGSHVKAGQILATLDAPELGARRAESQSNVEAAEAQLAAARAKAEGDRATLERLKAASATAGVVAGNELSIADANAGASASQVNAARHQVDAAKQSLSAVTDTESYLRITAPFSGVITERNAHPGALVGPSTTNNTPPILRLVDSSRLRLTVAVPEAYAADLHTGADVGFTVAAFPGHTFTGRIARIADAIDVTTRTMAVELDVANGDGQLAPGTFCQVQWTVRRTAPSLFVPSGSIATTTDRTFVVRIRDGKTEWVDVRTGLTSGGLIEIFGDLKPGDAVAARGTDELKPGTGVRARDAKPSA